MPFMRHESLRLNRSRKHWELWCVLVTEIRTALSQFCKMEINRQHWIGRTLHAPSQHHQRAKQWKPTEMKQKKNIYQIGCGEQWIECSVIMQNCIHKIKCHTHTQARMIMGDRRHARRVPSRQFIAIEDAHIFFLPFISSSHYRVVRTRHTDAWRHVRHRTYVRHQLHSGGGGDGDGNIAGSIE